MGVLCQYVVEKTVESSSPPFPSARMAQLFYEFLGRYNDWKLARRLKTIGMIIVLSLGLLVLIIPWLSPNIGITVNLVIFILFYLATKHYIVLNERVTHSYVNVHILHHHLIGKLEVGFCDHREPCHCAEDFRMYVIRNYDISFDNGFLK